MKINIHSLAIISLALVCSALAVERNYLDKKFNVKFGEKFTQNTEIGNTQTLRFKGTLTLDTSLTSKNSFYLHILPLEGNFRVWVKQADHNPSDSFYHFKRLSSRTKTLDIEIEQIKQHEKETTSTDMNKQTIGFEVRSGLLPKAGSKDYVLLD